MQNTVAGYKAAPGAPGAVTMDDEKMAAVSSCWVIHLLQTQLQFRNSYRPPCPCSTRADRKCDADVLLLCQVRGPGQSFENSQLSCTSEVKAVVRGHIRHVFFKTRLKDKQKFKIRTDSPGCVCDRLSPDLSCEDVWRQANRPQEEAVDLPEGGGVHRSQQEVQTSGHINSSKNTWKT